MMVGRPHPNNFLNYQLGHVLEFPVVATPTSYKRSGKMARLITDRRPHREWVKVEDGRRVSATYKGQKLELEFGRRSNLQRVRQWLGDAQRPRLASLELTASLSGALEGTLCLLQTALTAVLDEAPEIVLPEAIVEQVGSGRLEKCRNRLVKSGGINSPWPDEAFVLVMEVPVQLNSEQRQEDSEIKLILANDHELICRLEGRAGAQYLKAVGYEKRQGERVRKLAGVKFVGVPKMPRFVGSEEEVRGASLELLEPVKNDELTAWTEYEFAQRERRRALLKRRQEVELEYDEVTGEPVTDQEDEDKTYWRVRLQNGVEDCEKWLDEGKSLKSRPEKIGAAVEIHGLVKGAGSSGKAARASVERLESDGQIDRVVATIAWTRSESLPQPGKILAREHHGDVTQEKRREATLARLLHGQGGNPNLLRYLFFPQTIPAVEGKNQRMWHRPGAQRLNESQKQAVIRAAKEPALLLIQGPPGTGKTTVIAEIIHQLRHRYRNRTDGEPGSGQGPLRVLVSSIQNEAVANAADKLGGDEVFVGRHVRGEETDRAAELRGRAIAGRLWEQMSERDTFQRYQKLCSLRESVETLAAHIFSEPSRATDYLEEFAQVEELSLFGTTVQDDLDELREGLEELIADEEALREEEEEEVSALPHDLEAALGRVLARPEALMINDWGVALELVEELSMLIEEGTPEVDAQTLDLQSGLGRCRRALRRAKRVGEVDDKARDKWVRLRQEVQLLLSDEEKTDDNEQPPSPREEWLLRAQKWLSRMREDVSQRLGEVSTSEEAILFDWIKGLNERPAMMEKIVSEYAPVRATTCQKSERFYDDDRPYDVVIIDEAARGGLDVLIPMTMGRSIILIGDQNQLPPHVDQELERQLDEGIRREVDLTKTSLFSYLWEELGGPAAHSNCVALVKQYRMHRDIGEIVSRAFYEPVNLKLEHHCKGGVDAARWPKFGLFDDEPFVWLDTSDVLQDKGRRRRWSWPCVSENVYEVELIVKLLGELSEEALERLKPDEEEKKTIGVIPFYNDQRKLLRRKIESELPHLDRYIELGTADSFQGKDFPLVVLSTVRSNDEGKVGFLALPNRLNVGVSRAKNQVILLGDSTTLAPERPDQGSKPFKLVWSQVNADDEPGRVVRSLDFLANS